MTYIRFHLLFNFPVTLVLLLLSFLLGGSWQVSELLVSGVLAVIVLLFTFPWDNWAVKQGIWGFPPDRVWKKMDALPVEEVAFFLWQMVNVVLLTRVLFSLFPQWKTGAQTAIGSLNFLGCGLILVIWCGLGMITRWRSPQPKWNYGWHLLFWFLPLILFQWALVPGLMWGLLPLLSAVTLICGSYYVWCDLIAVRAGVWFFDEAQITGWKLGGFLPWEEIAFFYLTSLLVVQSDLLLLPAALR